MPSEPEDFEARVTALENEVRVVRADAAAARVLAGGADRDVADLKVKLEAHTLGPPALHANTTATDELYPRAPTNSA